MGRALATARLYEFRPLYGGGKSPTSQCSWELDVEWNMDYSKSQPLHQWGRAAYIECAALHNGPVDRGGIVANKCLRYR